MRGSPSASAPRAAFSPAPLAQPPPIHPATIVPSGRIMAFAPALAAVTDTVRTTVASTKACSAAFICATRSITSTCAPISKPRKVRFERRQALQRVGWRIEVDIWQRRLNTARFGRVTLPSHHRVEPDNAAAAAAEGRHLATEQRGVAGLIAIRNDHHAGARMNHACGMPAIESLQALADSGAATGALGHDREAIECAAGVPFFHGIRDVSQSRVEQECFGLAKFVEHTVDEAQKDAGIHAHRTGRVEQNHEPQGFLLALPFDE